MRFHIRGGATPTIILRDFKEKTDENGDPFKHAGDVIVMRYARLEDGTWKAPRPEMRLRRTGPLQQRVTLAWRRLRRRSRKQRVASTVTLEIPGETPAQDAAKA
jgi:hypothetical protein